MLAYYAAVVKPMECARVVAWRHVRCDESAIGSMIEWFVWIALGATTKITLMTVETIAGTKSETAVYKTVTP